jgi:hypothetical protein
MVMKRLVLALATVLATLVAVSPTSANVPGGKGLEILEGLPVDLTCDGQLTTRVVVTRGGGATGWRATPQNQHHVLSWFSITEFNADGSVAWVDEKRWGKKTGIAPLRCVQDFRAFGIPTLIEGTIHPLPGAKG